MFGRDLRLSLIGGRDEPGPRRRRPAAGALSRLPRLAGQGPAPRPAPGPARFLRPRAADAPPGAPQAGAVPWPQRGGVPGVAPSDPDPARGRCRPPARPTAGGPGAVVGASAGGIVATAGAVAGCRRVLAQPEPDAAGAAARAGRGDG